MSEPLIVRYRSLWLVLLVLMMILDVLAIVTWFAAGRWPLAILFICLLVPTFMLHGIIKDYGRVKGRP